MLSAENLASIESEGRRLGQAVRRDPDRPVPQYPDWTLADLASHTASIHGRTALICRELPKERISAPRLPEGMDPVEWYEEILDEMLEALRAADPDAPCWAFGPEPNVGFWERRMAIETGVHRWDAYQAFGEEDRLTDLVARSGLDEFGDMWLPHLGEVPTLQVMATDMGRSWVYGEGEPAASVEGTASDLYLRLVSRPSPVGLPREWAEAVDSLTPPPKR
ncbi:MAG: maleylpyruvate isomerase family mycothiol-dependent enzyme [Actinomycetota bacterium]